MHLFTGVLTFFGGGGRTITMQSKLVIIFVSLSKIKYN